jgi:hypothetical protein
MGLNVRGISGARHAHGKLSESAPVRQPSLFPLRRIKFIILDTSRKCALNRSHQSNRASRLYRTLNRNESKLVRGSLFPFSALGLNSETEGERFAMQLFKELCILFYKACC